MCRYRRSAGAGACPEPDHVSMGIRGASCLGPSNKLANPSIALTRPKQEFVDVPVVLPNETGGALEIARDVARKPIEAGRRRVVRNQSSSDRGDAGSDGFWKR